MIHVGSSLLQVYVVDVFLAVAVGFPFGSKLFCETFFGKVEIIDF